MVLNLLVITMQWEPFFTYYQALRVRALFTYYHVHSGPLLTYHHALRTMLNLLSCTECVLILSPWLTHYHALRNILNLLPCTESILILLPSVLKDIINSSPSTEDHYYYVTSIYSRKHQHDTIRVTIFHFSILNKTDCSIHITFMSLKTVDAAEYLRPSCSIVDPNSAAHEKKFQD
jgi:hypothetical protein